MLLVQIPYAYLDSYIDDYGHIRFRAVSYTHLDVYKRQAQYNVILDKKKGLNEVELSYYAGTDGVDVPEYNIYCLLYTSNLKNEWLSPV